jgi:Adenylate and Guanylate cyclase catalytic domain
MHMHKQVYTAFDRHIEPSGVYKLDTIGDAFVVVAGLDGYKSKVKFKLLHLMLLDLTPVCTAQYECVTCCAVACHIRAICCWRLLSHTAYAHATT